MAFRRSATSSRDLVSWVILGLTVLLIVTGLVSGGAYLYLRFRGPSRGHAPLGQLGSDKIDPSLALLTLAGSGDLEVVNRALAHRALGTAYATAFFGTELSDAERVGSLLLLAQAYAEAGDGSMARLCYRQANFIVTLSPSVADSAKANAYLEIVEGLAQVGSRAEALSGCDQAFVVASDSPYVKNPHRADIFGDLAAAYESLGQNAKAEECSERQAETGYVLGEEETRQTPPQQPVSPLSMEATEPTGAMISSYEQRRVDSVRQLLDVLERASPGDAMPGELMTDVARALLNEDGARRNIYGQESTGASSIVLKTGIAKARVDWLTVKYRVATGGYGLELVPAWSDDVTGVEAELNAAYRELHSTYDEQISTLSDDGSVDRAWLHLLRYELQQGSLGLYPNYPEEELVLQLREVTERLIASGDPSLHVEVLYQGDISSFILVAP